MELKLASGLPYWRTEVSLNRTFMELKPTKKDKDGERETSLNRTFMELKRRRALTNSLLAFVLIVPLWN